MAKSGERPFLLCFEFTDGTEEQGQPVNILFRMEMTGIPVLIGQAAFNTVQPDFGGFVHQTLVNRGEENLRGNVFERRGVGQYRIHLPVPGGQGGFHLLPDGRGGLLIRPPAPTFGQAVELIHAVGPADASQRRDRREGWPDASHDCHGWKRQ